MANRKEKKFADPQGVSAIITEDNKVVDIRTEPVRRQNNPDLSIYATSTDAIAYAIALG